MTLNPAGLLRPRLMWIKIYVGGILRYYQDGFTQRQVNKFITVFSECDENSREAKILVGGQDGRQSTPSRSC